mgnify:CR=1 FL=1
MYEPWITNDQVQDLNELKEILDERDRILKLHQELTDIANYFSYKLPCTARTPRDQEALAMVKLFREGKGLRDKLTDESPLEEIEQVTTKMAKVRNWIISTEVFVPNPV